MDNNLDQNKASQTFSGSQPGGVPPSPSVNVRTMESDQKSMAANGGSQPAPEKINITSIPGNDPKVSFSNFSDGNKGSSFVPPVPPAPKPGVQSGAVMPSPMPPKKKSSMVLVIVLVIVLVLLIIGGYLAYSMFLSKPASAPVSSNLPPFPTLPPTSTLANTTSSVTSSTLSIATQTLNIIPSVFKTSPDANLEINISSSSTINNLKSAIVSAIPTNISTSSTSSFYSITVNENNQLANAASLMALIDPVFSSTTMSNFSPTLTVFAYKDSKGIWPGYILTISSTSNPVAVQKALVSFESSNLSGFYLSGNIGTFGQFKNGQLNGNPTRYAVSNNDYSLDYGIWNGQYVIFSTSYVGLGEAVKKIEGL